MVTILFISATGEERRIDAQEGLSLMESAIGNSIDTIEAICGGNAYCGTCRVYIDPAWRAIMGEATEIELPMIQSVGDDSPGVRLSCQITVTAAHEGLVVRTPSSQR